MELTLWCDLEFENLLTLEFLRRWGFPLLDGGTVRLPRIVGQGKVLEIVLTGRKVLADECYKMGFCEYLVEDGISRQKS